MATNIKKVRNLTKEEENTASKVINDICIDGNMLLQCSNPAQTSSYLTFDISKDIEEDVKRYISFHVYRNLEGKIKLFWRDKNVRLEKL